MASLAQVLLLSTVRGHEALECLRTLLASVSHELLSLLPVQHRSACQHSCWPMHSTTSWTQWGTPAQPAIAEGLHRRHALSPLPLQSLQAFLSLWEADKLVSQSFHPVRALFKTQHIKFLSLCICNVKCNIFFNLLQCRFISLSASLILSKPCYQLFEAFIHFP